MSKESKGDTHSGEFDPGPDQGLMKARKRQMNRAWNEATLGEGFFLPFSLITRPKRTLVLALGIGAFVFTVGGLWNVAGGFIAGSDKDPNLADPASIGGAVGEGGRNLTEATLREIQQRVGGSN